MSTAVVNSFNATNWRCQSRRIPRTDNSSTSHPRSAAMTPCGTARPQVRQHEAQRGLKHRRLGRAAGEPAEREHLRHVPALENQSRRFAFPAGVVSPVLPRRAERLEAHLTIDQVPDRRPESPSPVGRLARPRERSVVEGPPRAAPPRSPTAGSGRTSGPSSGRWPATRYNRSHNSHSKTITARTTFAISCYGLGCQRRPFRSEDLSRTF